MSIGFGPKNAWVAVHSVSAEALADALGVGGLKPADWDQGIDLAYERGAPGVPRRGVFITPPLRHWTLCVGAPLFEDRKGFTAELSRRLDGREVQHFATYRVSDWHFWERAVGGEMTRYCRWADGELVQEGEPTPGEQACGFKINPSDAELATLGDDAWDDYWMPDEDFVLDVAGAWSINPYLIEEEFPDAGPGFIGRTLPCPPTALDRASGRSWIRGVWRALVKK